MADQNLQKVLDRIRGDIEGCYFTVCFEMESGLPLGMSTLEFENVPTESVAVAERHTPVRPGSHVLAATQHRVREKTFLRDKAGVPVGPFAPVGSLAELRDAAATLGLPAVLKTAQMGYDGKGQRVLRDASELADAWSAIGPGDCIYEAFVDFRREPNGPARANETRYPGGDCTSDIWV